MDASSGRDGRFNLGYSMNLLGSDGSPDIYPQMGRPGPSLQQQQARQLGRAPLKPGAESCYDDRVLGHPGLGLDSCAVADGPEDSYGNLQVKKSPPSNGKKTKGRVKIKMEYIENKLRRYTTFSKRKTGIMKKAYELSTLTGTQVMLLVASETGHVYTFATRKLQPMITSEAGKALIQTCLNSPDPPAGGGGGGGGDQRMSATGFEETELTYNISDDDSKDEEMSAADSSGESSGAESPTPKSMDTIAVKSESRATSSTSAEDKRATSTPQAAGGSLMGPLLYQVPPGMMSTSNGVIFSLQGAEPPPQFITIPLSVAMPATGAPQQELDLSKRK